MKGLLLILLCAGLCHHDFDVDTIAQLNLKKADVPAEYSLRKDKTGLGKNALKYTDV